MAKMILSMDGLVLKEIPLTKERMTIGRKAHNDIQIDNLAISGEHAAVVTILNDSFLEDLNSTNGTLVNGQPIKSIFKNNDVVELGKYKLRYIAEQAAPVADAGDFEKTMVLRPNMVRPAGARGRCSGHCPAVAATPAAAPAPESVRRHTGRHSGSTCRCACRCCGYRAGRGGDPDPQRCQCRPGAGVDEDA